jgi:hypothetical protein
MAEDNTTKPPASQKSPPERLPYEPPAVIIEEAFETLALSCGKGNGICLPPGSGKS